jgi:4-amino-4-deoxy-L-arabinose transferase-like glycosyltransferase
MDRSPDRPPWEGTTLPPGTYRWGVALATLLGAALRFAHITRPFNRLMAWNEGHYAMIALNFDRYGLWSQRNELGVDRTFSPGVPWLVWASMKAFGPTEAAARLPVAIAGVAAIALMAALARRLARSEPIGLASAAFVAVAPGLVYFAQNVQLDTPSICCALAAAVLMLRYRDTRRRADAVWSGVWLAAAVWLKFTTMLLYPAFLVLWWPVRPKPPRAAAGIAALFVAATVLPSALWIAAGWLTFSRSSGFTKRFFFRDWDLRGIVKALSEIPLAVEAHLFIAIFVLLIVGIVAAVRWHAGFRAVWAWCAPWVLLYIFAPWDSLTNRYYDLPATYLLTILAAIGLWVWTARDRRGRAHGAPPAGARGAAGPAGRANDPRQRAAPPARLIAALLVVVGLTTAYDVWDPMTDRIARASMAHVPPIDPSPFYSAKIVAALPRGRTVADTPQTMFYAGGDPAWIDITGGDVRWKINAEEFDYVIINDYGHGQEPYYAIEPALRAQFADHHYVQVAPGAWAHMRTRIADLGGYREPSIPYWSPAGAGRRLGTAAWQ